MRHSLEMPFAEELLARIAPVRVVEFLFWTLIDEVAAPDVAARFLLRIHKQTTNMRTPKKDNPYVDMITDLT